MDFILPFSYFLLAALAVFAPVCFTIAFLLRRSKIVAGTLGLFGTFAGIYILYLGLSFFTNDPEMNLKKRAWPVARLLVVLIESANSGQDAPDHSEIGEVAFGARLYDTAIEELKLEMRNSDSDVKNECFSKMGRCYRFMKEFEHAIACYDSALFYKPGDFSAWYSLANTMVTLGDIEQAVASFDSALFYEQERRGNPVIADYNAAKMSHPFRHGSWTNAAHAVSELEQYERAIACYDSALTYPGMYPHDYARAWYRRGLLFMEIDDYVNAVTSFDSSLACVALPNDSGIRDIYSWDRNTDTFNVWRDRSLALRKINRYDEAISSIDSALSCLSKPNNPYLLGMRKEIENEKLKAAGNQ